MDADFRVTTSMQYRTKKVVLIGYGEVNRMSELIDRNMAITHVNAVLFPKINTAKEAEKALRQLPVIDAVPVRHGKWKIEEMNTFEMSYGTTGYEPVYRCSVCERVTESYFRYEKPIMPEDADFPRFCPNCGADMRGEKDD